MINSQACKQLGIYGEAIFASRFPSAIPMKLNQIGYDFLHNGLKVDVKTTHVGEYQRWHFGINNAMGHKECRADVFYCIGLDKGYIVLHTWTIPASSIGRVRAISIGNNIQSLKRWSPYECK
jgi:hypothetical protein